MATLFNSISIIILAVGLIFNSIQDNQSWKTKLLLAEKIVAQQETIKVLKAHNAEMGKALGIPVPILEDKGE